MTKFRIFLPTRAVGSVRTFIPARNGMNHSLKDLKANHITVEVNEPVKPWHQHHCSTVNIAIRYEVAYTRVYFVWKSGLGSSCWDRAVGSEEIDTFHKEL